MDKRELTEEIAKTVIDGIAYSDDSSWRLIGMEPFSDEGVIWLQFRHEVVLLSDSNVNTVNISIRVG